METMNDFLLHIEVCDSSDNSTWISFLANVELTRLLFDLIKQQKASGIVNLLSNHDELYELSETMKDIGATHILKINQYEALRSLYPNRQEYPERR